MYLIRMEHASPKFRHSILHTLRHFGSRMQTRSYNQMFAHEVFAAIRPHHPMITCTCSPVCVCMFAVFVVRACVRDLYICVCMCMCYIYVDVCVCVCVCVYACMYACMYLYTHSKSYAETYINNSRLSCYTHIRVCIYIYTYIYIYIYIYKCIKKSMHAN